MSEPDNPQALCASETLKEGGTGLRFHILSGGAYTDAFAVRYRGEVYAYLNRCAHQGITLDWNNGEFFDTDGRYLICSAHGALYEPTDGHCVGGRCAGGRLVPLAAIERDGQVFINSTQPIRQPT